MTKRKASSSRRRPAAKRARSRSSRTPAPGAAAARPTDTSALGRGDPFAYDHDPADRPRAALHAALARFRARPEVTGIDLGIKIEDGRHTKVIAVRIHVREKVLKHHLTPRERFPEKILGVPVDVIEAVYDDHAGFDPARQTHVSPICPGVSVGAPGGATGTLGLVVEDVVDGRRLVLGAAHVFAPSVDSRPGDTLLQPGQADGGGAPDAMGTLHRVDASTDAAVGAASAARPFVTRILGASHDPVGLRHPRLGDVLEKSGRTTGITRGRVDGIAPEFAGLHYVIRLVPIEGATGPLCDFGDSGSVWYDPDTGEAVALHCKGGNTPSQANAYAIATSLIYATRRLGARLPA